MTQGGTGASPTELAEERTEWAEDRTLLANERTFAGWMRTGLAAVGIGVGFHALFDKLEPPYLARIIATVFVLTGIFAFIASARNANRVCARLEAHAATAAGRGAGNTDRVPSHRGEPGAARGALADGAAVGAGCLPNCHASPRGARFTDT